VIEERKTNPRKGPFPFEKWMLHNGQQVGDDNNEIVATTTIYEQRSHLQVAFESATELCPENHYTGHKS